MKLWRVVLLLVLTLVLPVRGALAVSMGMAVDAPPSAAHSAAPAKADAPCPHHAPATDHTQARHNTATMATAPTPTSCVMCAMCWHSVCRSWRPSAPTPGQPMRSKAASASPAWCCPSATNPPYRSDAFA